MPSDAVTLTLLRVDRARGQHQAGASGKRGGSRGAPLAGIWVAFLIAHASALHAASRWEFEARLGGAWNVPLPIVLRQGGYEDLRLTARWRTEALKQPVYYAWRVTQWDGDTGWALDLTHHKLYLENPPPEVRNFSISHGYNLVTIQRLEECGGWRYGGAVGTVVAHPESEIRSQRFEEDHGLLRGGYYVSGPTAGVLVGRSRALQGRLHWTAEARVTLSFARVPVAGGSASVPNLALHATAGLGWRVPGESP